MGGEGFKLLNWMEYYVTASHPAKTSKNIFFLLCSLATKAWPCTWYKLTYKLLTDSCCTTLGISNDLHIWERFRLEHFRQAARSLCPPKLVPAAAPASDVRNAGANASIADSKGKTVLSFEHKRMIRMISQSGWVFFWEYHLVMTLMTNIAMENLHF